MDYVDRFQEASVSRGDLKEVVVHRPGAPEELHDRGLGKTEQVAKWGERKGEN